MLKLLHGADFHLDSPFSGLTPEQAALRRSEQRQLLDRLAQTARDKEADLVLDTREGKYIFYQLNASVLEEILWWISDLKGENAHETH